MTSKSIGNSKVSIKLTDKEVKILWHLVKEKNSIVNQNFLLNKVWGYKDDIETKTLTTHIYTMRKKLDYFNGIFTIELHLFEQEQELGRNDFANQYMEIQ